MRSLSRNSLLAIDIRIWGRCARNSAYPATLIDVTSSAHTWVHALTITCLAPKEERAGVWRERPCTKRHRRLRGQSHLESHPSKPFNDTLAPLAVCTLIAVPQVLLPFRLRNSAPNGQAWSNTTEKWGSIRAFSPVPRFLAFVIWLPWPAEASFLFQNARFTRLTVSSRVYSPL